MQEKVGRFPANDAFGHVVIGDDSPLKIRLIMKANLKLELFYRRPHFTHRCLVRQMFFMVKVNILLSPFKIIKIHFFCVPKDIKIDIQNVSQIAINFYLGKMYLCV